MTYTLIVRPEVDADLERAHEWYEQQMAGLGGEFVGGSFMAVSSNVFMVVLMKRCQQGTSVA